jgi:putrescine:ornithine antiporter
VANNVYTCNVVIVVVGMGHSVFALYASGKDAVMGGMLVLGIVYIVWGFITNRFTGQLEGSSTTAAKV